MATQYYVGTSGWHYEHWKGLFYAPTLSKARWLAYYAQHFSTVELNNSFYHLPSSKAFEAWRDTVPPGFLFAVKVSRFITHLKKLRGVEAALETFLTRARLLKDRLGPLLYQLPPNLHRHDDRLESFLTLLPKDLRHVFEFRHESWLHSEVFQLLRRHGAGLCVFDMPRLSCPVEATADFTYLRFHGSTGLYSSCYSLEEMRDWAQKIAGLGAKEVYIYFNNDAQAYAVRNAKEIATFLAEPQ